jgi:hypothetical protein
MVKIVTSYPPLSYGRSGDFNYPLAPSRAQFLEDLADELVAGDFDLDLRRKSNEFRIREPGKFQLNDRA